MKHIAMTKIGQFRNVVKPVIDAARFVGTDENGEPIFNETKPPVLKFTGTVKLHGTCASVCYDGKEIWAQSKNNIITPEKDNAGFARFVYNNKEYFEKLMKSLYAGDTMALFGEWAGCFTANTPILLADGTKMRIGKIVNNKLDVEVMTYNLVTGKLEAKKVIDWHRNGKTDNWLKIIAKRRKRGGRGTAIVCTPNHKIFVKNQGVITEKYAKDLNNNDLVCMPCKVLNNNLKDFLRGSLLGDASFMDKRAVVISHSDDNQPFYNDFIGKLLAGKSYVNRRVSGHGSNMRVHTTHSFPELEDLYDELHLTNSKKKLPTIKYLNRLSPIALAAWYMDDGSLINHTHEDRQIKAAFHIEGFGHTAVEMICTWFNSRGYECNTVTNGRGNKEIRFTPKGTMIFLYQIAPYMLKEFDYKLPPTLREMEKINWSEHILGEYDEAILATKVISIESFCPEKDHQKIKYDITVEGNSNYFANNILVHNSGVQAKVAISNIHKSFFIFGLKVPDKGWLPLDFELEDHPNVFKITDFKTYEVEVDFDNPRLSQNKIVEMVEEVEAECPVAKMFGFSGIGEGIVFDTFFKDKRFVFKAKGEKHVNKFKVKKLNKVDDAKLQLIQEVAEKVTPAWRLEQMWNEVFDIINGGEPTIKKTGDFLKAVSQDVIKEDLDILEENNLTMKDVGGTISKIAKRWFMEKLDEETLGVK